MKKLFLILLGWDFEWRTALLDLAILLIALLAANLLHFLLYAAMRRFGKWRGRFTFGVIITHTSRPARFLLMLAAMSTVLSSLVLSSWLAIFVNHILEIGYIVSLAWLAVGLIDTLNALIKNRLPDDIQDNVRARRTRTQVHLLRQILTGLIIFSAIAAVLMTFPAIRNVGTGLFASAGLAGLALGMAARPTLGNLIAGIQIALAEHIRLGDAVVVEGEWGHVAEVSTTYVVVRLWDLRHMVVPLSYFIEKPFQNWTRYSSELTGAVLLYLDYCAPIDQLREVYSRILNESPLWNGKIMAVQVTDVKEHSIELRFLMSAANPTSTFDLRCHVREKLIDYLQKNHAHALPKIRNAIAVQDRH